jgi:histone H3/H4
MVNVDKDSGVEEEVTEAVAAAPDAVAGEEVIDESKYAFAMAPVVRLMKDELDKDKMIRSRVKVEMNLWLEKVCRKISKQMNRSDYTMVEVDDFKTAIEPYEMIDDVEGERMRIVATLEKIKQDCDSLIRDVNRKFIVPNYIQETRFDKGAVKEEPKNGV